MHVLGPTLAQHSHAQGRIQVFGLEGAKFCEGSGDRLGPALVGGTGVGGEAPRKLLQFSDFRVQKSCIFMSKLPSPVATM